MIVDFDESMNWGQPPAKKAKIARNTAPRSEGAKPTTATKRAPKKVEKRIAEPQFYEGDGWRIQIDGRRKARKLDTLAAKYSKEKLYEIVEEYAGQAAVASLANHTKVEIARWISEKEALAFGEKLPARKRKVDDLEEDRCEFPKKRKLGNHEDLLSSASCTSSNHPTPATSVEEMFEEQTSDDDGFGAALAAALMKDATSPVSDCEIVDENGWDSQKLSTASPTPTPTQAESPTETASSTEASFPQFLKPGKHGWDYENHRWGFQGDPDLETGVGHSIDPDDEERLMQSDDFAAEYNVKYPGRGAHQWPCGCHRVTSDYDSEAE